MSGDNIINNCSNNSIRCFFLNQFCSWKALNSNVGGFFFYQNEKKYILYLIMIQIKKGTTNTLALTLNEKITLTNPYFLFEFENDETKSKYYCIGQQVLSSDRYNKITVKETSATPNGTMGEVKLQMKGFYQYTIREQASSTNLNPSLSGSIVESGKALVTDTTTQPTAYDSQSKETIVYNG